MFIYHHDANIAYLLLYVDDIVLTTSSTTQLRSIVVQRGVFHDRSRALNYFLGISVAHSPQGLFLFQQKYASKILEHAYMLQCNPTRTPVETTHKLDCSGPPILDRSFYRSFVGALRYLIFTLLYLTITCTSIAFTVQQIYQLMHDPRERHFHTLKHILKYIKGTLYQSLQLHDSSSSDLHTYSNAD